LFTVNLTGNKQDAFYTLLQIFKIMIGNILRSRYKIIEPLGNGGFGQTYIAEDLDLPSNPKPRCVVKMLQPSIIDPDVIRLFTQEATIIYNLGENHHQIPNLKAYFQENNRFYLIQDLIIGHDLGQEIIPGKQWDESYVINLFTEVLNVLAFVHENNVIHRDIKPQNLIRRQQDGKLILIDFGAVKQIKQPILTSGVTSKTISIGTPGYMPSEQAIGKPKFSSDIYALGMTAIQALTGQLPWELPEDNDGEIIWQNLTNVSDKLAVIINKMVRYHFSQRYKNAGEVLTALNQAFSPSLNLSSQGQNPSPITQKQTQNTPPPKVLKAIQTNKADYRQLEQYLFAQQWKDADKETANILLKIMYRENEGYLTENNCKNFFPDELIILDNLWAEYSDGNFGYTAQKNIWICCGGTAGIAYPNVYKKFAEQVGWKKKGVWLSYSELNFNIYAPKGHLPVVLGFGGIYEIYISFLLSRI
jgi:eukaryotic-like serine/threonine-protein kinase